MSGPISLKGNSMDVAWMLRWLAGDDALPIDWHRRRPTTLAELELCWDAYKEKTLMNSDETKDHDEDEAGTYR